MKNKLLILIIFVLFLGCKKYSEDPFISMKSPEKRLEGDWQITSYKIDGVESLALFLPTDSFNNLGFNQNSYPPKVSFFRDNKYEGHYNTTDYGMGWWYLLKTQNYDYLNIQLQTLPLYQSINNMTWPPLFFNEKQNLSNVKSLWLVKRLYKNKLHLIQYNTKKYELEFKKR
jgi:hypothetical protein